MGGIDEKKLKVLKGLNQQTVTSMDAVDGWAVMWESKIAKPDEFVERSIMRVAVDKALSTLTPIEAEVVRQYYGFDDDAPKSIGEVVSIIQEKFGKKSARPILNRALEKLR